MEIQKWEYKKVIFKGTEGEFVIEADLNSLGKEGWELVDVVSHIYKTNTDPKRELQMQTFYLKRPRIKASDIVFTSDLKKTTEDNVPGGSA